MPRGRFDGTAIVGSGDAIAKLLKNRCVPPEVKAELRKFPRDWRAEVQFQGCEGRLRTSEDEDWDGEIFGMSSISAADWRRAAGKVVSIVIQSDEELEDTIDVQLKK